MTKKELKEVSSKTNNRLRGLYYDEALQLINQEQQAKESYNLNEVITILSRAYILGNIRKSKRA